MQRVVTRVLPDGSSRRVQPFHVSLEGLETAVICHDDEDYDAVEKMLCICSLRKNVLIVIHAIVSNHVHVAVLAESLNAARAYTSEVKRMIGMWARRRSGDVKLMKKVKESVQCLDTDWYVRNALAYIPRNALDNGCNVNEYRWSGYQAMFSTSEPSPRYRKVATLTKREKAQIFHTCEDLSNVPWLIDGKGQLVPASFCDTTYLEQAFENDQSYFLRTIGGLNGAEMRHKLIDLPRSSLPDGEFYRSVNDIAQRWFKSDISQLPIEKKIRLLPYVDRTMKTSIPQLARIFGMTRDSIAAYLKNA